MAEVVDNDTIQLVKLALQLASGDGGLESAQPIFRWLSEVRPPRRKHRTRKKTTPLTWKGWLRNMRLNNQSISVEIGMSLEAFEALYAKLVAAPGWFPGLQGINRRYLQIEGRCKLYMTIANLRGSKWGDLAGLFRVSAGAWKGFFKKTIQCIRDVLVNEQQLIPPGHPNAGKPRISYDADFRAEIAREFVQSANHRREGLGHIFSGAIGCVDGILIGITAPELNRGIYYSRKDKHALAVQAVCDSRGRIVYWHTRSPGSYHDSTAWLCTGMANTAINGFFGTVNVALEGEPACWVESFIIGDTAYRSCPGIVTPFGAQSENHDDNFNYCLSSTRVKIEQTFGWLMRRYPKLKNLQHPDMNDSRMIIEAAMSLHNFLIDWEYQGLSSDGAIDEENVVWSTRAEQENVPDIRAGQTAGTREQRNSGWAKLKRARLSKILRQEQVGVDASFQAVDVIAPTST